MNERLHDIMMEATKDMPHCYYWPGEYVGKFAELLIKECAGIVETESERGTEHTITQILKHFGVEE